MNDKKIENIIIIGSGPAAHTSAIYTSRASLNPLMFEGFMAGGIAAGGQLTTTTEIENFPGFPDAIGGIQLMQKMRQQSINYGTKILTETVSKVKFHDDKIKEVINEDGKSYFAKALIIATGATAKKMNLLGEDIYWQKGVSACAICDGNLPVFKNASLAVIGGGDTACEEALYLSRNAKKVYVLIRRNEMRASKSMQEKVLKSPKIELVFETSPIEILGDGDFINGLKIKNNNTQEESILEIKGLFYAIGHKPNVDFLERQIELDDHGYIITKGKGSYTSKEGVFACGDVQDSNYRQAISAAGSGCIAAIDAERYLEE